MPPDLDDSRSSASALCLADAISYHVLDVLSLLLKLLDLSFLCSHSDSLSDATLSSLCPAGTLFPAGFASIGFRLQSLPLQSTATALPQRMTSLLDDGDGNRRWGSRCVTSDSKAEASIDGCSRCSATQRNRDGRLHCSTVIVEVERL
jgi:hypothetical protein